MQSAHKLKGGARYSEWSSSLCKTRRLTGPNEVEYLPWPKVAPLPAEEPLTVEMARDYVTEEQGQEVDKQSVLIHFNELQGMFSLGNPLCEYSLGVDNTVDFSQLFFTEFHCGLAGKTRFDNSLASPFMLYRQARASSGKKGL